MRLPTASATGLAIIGAFGFGVYAHQRATAAQWRQAEARLEALRVEMAGQLSRMESRERQLDRHPALDLAAIRPDLGNERSRSSVVDEIKRQLQTEMGLTPIKILKDRRQSFVELYAYDSEGRRDYGTAGYLGGGYFITVKHAVVALHDEDDRQSSRKIQSVKVVYRGKEIPAKVIDTGDADVEVHSGDWAIIKTRELDLPALQVDTAFDYAFADPIFRLGNDYSKGIMLSAGYVGQRTENGLVTCLTDGHPGVSGGGVLDQRGNLVGIPIGRMQGDYRFSFILPLRAEMLRKLPAYEQAEPAAHAAGADPQ